MSSRFQQFEPLEGTGARPRKAVILVLTLWVVVVLGLIATTLAFDVQLGSKTTLLHKESFVAYNLAKSAVAAGMVNLQNDLLIDQAENPNQYVDSFADVWAQAGVKERDREVELGKGTYEVVISDEEGKIPINQANIKLIKGMLEYYGFEAPDSDDVAAAIVDYRDQDDTCAAQPGDNENEFYSGLMGQKIDRKTGAGDLLYRCANEPLLSVDQLLDVYGIAQNPHIFLGYDPEEREERQLKLRDSIAEGKASSKRKGRKRKNEPLPMRDIVTVNTPGGRVNLNTAPVEVLAILIYAATNFSSLDSAQAAAESIDEFRGGGKKGRALDPDDAFKSLADMAKVPGVDISAFNQMGGLGVQPVFKSETFNVKGIGKTKRVTREVTAIVDRKMEVFNPDDNRLAGGDRKRSSARKGRRGSSRGKRGEQADNYIRIPTVRVIQWIE